MAIAAQPLQPLQPYQPYLRFYNKRKRSNVSLVEYQDN